MNVNQLPGQKPDTNRLYDIVGAVFIWLRTKGQSPSLIFYIYFTHTLLITYTSFFSPVLCRFHLSICPDKALNSIKGRFTPTKSRQLVKEKRTNNRQCPKSYYICNYEHI